MQAIDVITRTTGVDPDISHQAISDIWIASQYLEGSRQGETPFEAVYAVGLVLSEWIPSRFAILTALTSEPLGYHLRMIDIRSKLGNMLPGLKFTSDGTQLIHVAMPRAFQRAPLLGIPLYHEVGHYIDLHYGISDRSALALIQGGGLTDLIAAYPHFEYAFKLGGGAVFLSYLREHFADVFAARYVKDALSRLLIQMTPPGSAVAFAPSHPPVVTRHQFVEDFLHKRSNLLLDVFQDIVRKLGSGELKPIGGGAGVDQFYDDVRPPVLDSESDLHHAFPSTLNYIEDNVQNKPAWTGIAVGETIDAVNSLLEKSIRNYGIRKSWPT